MAVTGLGVIAPGGVGREEFWNRIVDGKPAV
ncbi:beta-ketoacyl synthase N-terminal-like domain-containing protein, partial [Nonomuraea sp. NPDC055795]